MPLTPETERLWTAYLAAERDRVREVMLPALDRFLDALLGEAPATWKGWARALARQIADEGVAVTVRLPLYRRALLPALEEAVARGEAGAARWLASFAPLRHQAPGSLPPALRTSEGLLREALRVDPDDDRARRRLVEVVAPYLEYTLHELPSGILWDQDGATAEQCTELLGVVAELRGHAERLQVTARYAELISACELHYAAYRRYLVEGRPGGSYEAFPG